MLCLAYQPISQLAETLSAADLHLVLMGNAFVGLVHPCKIYNILKVGAPLLYIGPQPSHISEILHEINGQFPCGWAEHGQVEAVVQQIMRLQKAIGPRDGNQEPAVARRFSRNVLMPQFVATLEVAAKS